MQLSQLPTSVFAPGSLLDPTTSADGSYQGGPLDSSTAFASRQPIVMRPAPRLAGPSRPCLAAALGAGIPVAFGASAGVLAGVSALCSISLLKFGADIVRDTAHLALQGELKSATCLAVVESARLGACGSVFAATTVYFATICGTLLVTAPVTAMPCALWAVAVDQQFPLG